MDGIIQKIVVQPEGKKFGLRDQETLEKVDSFLTFNKEFIDVRSLNKGSDAQILTTVDGVIKWADPVIQLPASGKNGEVLTRLEDGSWVWAEPAHQLPDERVNFQILSVNKDGKLEWRDETVELPLSRENGDVLTVSGSSLVFAPPVKEIPSDGEIGDVLTRNDTTYAWKTPKKVYTTSEVDKTLESYYTKKEIDTKLSVVFKYKGSVTNYSDLEGVTPEVGDVWNIAKADVKAGINAGDNVCWTGTEWDILSGVVDTSAFLTSSDISSFITEDALSEGIVALATKYYSNSTEQYIPIKISRKENGNFDSPIIITCRAGETVSLGICRNDKAWEISSTWFKTSDKYGKIIELGKSDANETSITLWVKVKAYPNSITIYGKKSLSCSFNPAETTQPSYTTLTEITIPSSLPNPKSLTIGESTYNGSSEVSITSSDLESLLSQKFKDIKDSIPTVPKTLPNPTSLIIGSATYDGTSEVKISSDILKEILSTTFKSIDSRIQSLSDRVYQLHQVATMDTSVLSSKSLISSYAYPHFSSTSGTCTFSASASAVITYYVEFYCYDDPDNVNITKEAVEGQVTYNTKFYSSQPYTLYKTEKNTCIAVVKKESKDIKISVSYSYTVKVSSFTGFDGNGPYSQAFMNVYSS